jgi:hypothetical protein
MRLSDKTGPSAVDKALVSAQRIIRIKCPNLQCRSILSAPAHTRGKILKCARCGHMVLVPFPRRPDPAETTGDDKS